MTTNPATTTTPGPAGVSTGAPEPQVTVDEMIQSLTGFDELAIEKHFNGFDIYTDGEARGIRAMRALAFVQFRRNEMKDLDAFKAAQGLSFREVSSMYLPDELELDPDAPETASGKDSALPA
ncbi:hypothetical protein [Nocardioides bruguierae]|uniref:Uncharacterized protein n=1 Tax=Nocardioides bruguierae TaxID=2945102 RepID=A0A9X2D3R7_9ACTN|nr:hypothetical protein [Nocardioides bruguierae]MCM0618778.1 hypothetical protein [Nocardioides bruguierae]